MVQATTDALEVLSFVRKYLPGVLAVENMRGIGFIRDGQIVCGVLYENINKHSCWMHVAAVPGRRWMKREWLAPAFRYPFVELGLARVFGWVSATNTEAQRFDEHLGFKRQCVLEGAGSDGGDVIVYRMERAECRYVDSESV